MIYSHLGHSRLKQNLQQMYGITPTPEINIEALNALNKAEELGLLDYDASDIEKGRKAMPIGAKAVWGGVSYLKTAQGWKPVGKHRGEVKSNHDLIHNNDEKEKDHHTMVMDAGKMDEKEWTAKHGSNLHNKYKQVHDYLHKEKEAKPVEEKNKEVKDEHAGLTSQERNGVKFAEHFKKVAGEAKSAMDKFLERKKMTIDDYKNMSKKDQDKLNEEWRNSPENTAEEKQPEKKETKPEEKPVAEKKEEPADFSFLKKETDKQLEKRKDLAHQQLASLGQQHGMKQSDVDKYPEHIKRSYNHLNESIKQIDNEIAERQDSKIKKPAEKQTEAKKEESKPAPVEEKKEGISDKEKEDFAANAKFKTSGTGKFLFFNPSEDKQIRIEKNNKTGAGSGYHVTLHQKSSDGIGYESYSKNVFSTSLKEAKSEAATMYFNETRNNNKPTEPVNDKTNYSGVSTEELKKKREKSNDFAEMESITKELNSRNQPKPEPKKQEESKPVYKQGQRIVIKKHKDAFSSTGAFYSRDKGNGMHVVRYDGSNSLTEVPEHQIFLEENKRK